MYVKKALTSIPGPTANGRFEKIPMAIVARDEVTTVGHMWRLYEMMKQRLGRGVTHPNQSSHGERGDRGDEVLEQKCTRDDIEHLCPGVLCQMTRVDDGWNLCHTGQH